MKDELRVGRFLSRDNRIFPALSHYIYIYISFQTQSSSQSPRPKIFTLSLTFFSFLPQQIISFTIFLIQHLLYSLPILTTLVKFFFTLSLQFDFGMVLFSQTHLFTFSIFSFCSQTFLLYAAAR